MLLGPFLGDSFCSFESYSMSIPEFRERSLPASDGTCRMVAKSRARARAAGRPRAITAAAVAIARRERGGQAQPCARQ